MINHLDSENQHDKPHKKGNGNISRVKVIQLQKIKTSDNVTDDDQITLYMTSQIMLKMMGKRVFFYLLKET